LIRPCVRSLSKSANFTAASPQGPVGPTTRLFLNLALYCAVAWDAAPLTATSAQTVMRRQCFMGSPWVRRGVGCVGYSTRSETRSKNGRAGSTGKELLAERPSRRPQRPPSRRHADPGALPSRQGMAPPLLYRDRK